MQAEQMKGRRGILLDVDGTLWDSTSEVTDSWNDYGKGQPDVTHVITEDEMRGVFGRTMVEIACVSVICCRPSDMSTTVNASKADTRPCI